MLKKHDVVSEQRHSSHFKSTTRPVKPGRFRVSLLFRLNLNCVKVVLLLYKSLDK